MTDLHYRQITKMALEPVTETATRPTYGTYYSACFDIYADLLNREVTFMDSANQKHSYSIKDKLSIPPNWRVLIPTGFIWHIPKSMRLNFITRSGTAWKYGVNVMNSPATIDEDYLMESFVILHNTTDVHFLVNHKDRIAQGELNPVIRCDFDSFTNPRTGGFNSTGK